MEGKVQSIEQEPIVDAIVTVLETGDFGVTNALGLFTFPLSEELRAFTLQVETKLVSSSTTVDNLEPGPRVINLDIEVNEEQEQITVSDLDVLVKVVGTCDIYFENFRIIRQANQAPPGTICTAKVWINGDGKPLSRVPFSVQVRACQRGSEWRTLAAGETGSGGINVGIGQAQFPFEDSESNCVYRVIAPFDFQDLAQVVYRIHTFSKQAFDKENQ